jgi:hypothetical protein
MRPDEKPFAQRSVCRASTGFENGVTDIRTSQGWIAVVGDIRIDVFARALVLCPIVVSAGGTAVPGTIGSSGTQLTFTPSGLLAPGTVYTVTVSNFTDTQGRSIAPFTSTFTTNSQLTVVSVSPADGTANVQVNTSIVLTFSKAVNPISVNNADISISGPSVM